MKFLTVGKLTKNKDEVKAAVEELGGKMTGTTNKASFCLSTKSESPLQAHKICGDLGWANILTGGPQWVLSFDRGGWSCSRWKEFFVMMFFE